MKTHVEQLGLFLLRGDFGQTVAPTDSWLADVQQLLVVYP